ncbi:MAG: DUF4194 domain-containing protein [Pseudomonadota bacterium]
MDEQIATPPVQPDDLSVLAVALLKGVLYREADERLWSSLLNLQARVRDYVAVLNLELALDEAEGYAFLRSRTNDDDDVTSKAPRLVARRPLTFPVSLLLALLRKKLAEFDASGGTRLVLARDEIVQLVAVFLPTGSNESRIVDQIETHINKVVDLGFLRVLKASSGPPAYEVRRILKAFIDAQWLAEFDSRLESYRLQLAPPDEEPGNV